MDIFRFCEDIGRQVKEVITPLVGTEEGKRFVYMGADGTPTKYIDKVAEDLIIEALNNNEIGAYLISEEAGRIDLKGNEGTIILDPVDGTSNAVRNIPFYAVSLAYADDSGIKYGYIENLAYTEKYWAERTKGAFEDGKQISVSKELNLDKATLSIYSKGDSKRRSIRLLENIRRYRQFGASSLELAYVASGKIDGFVDLRSTLRITDAAAGILICNEAGGTVTDVCGNKINMSEDVRKGACMVASNGKLHQNIIECIS